MFVGREGGEIEGSGWVVREWKGCLFYKPNLLGQIGLQMSKRESNHDDCTAIRNVACVGDHFVIQFLYFLDAMS